MSLFGVDIMDGLIFISSFNAHRAHDLLLHEAITEGAAKRVRPVMMAALTTILGLLPAALLTNIGSQTKRPSAIVVVSDMVTARDRLRRGSGWAVLRYAGSSPRPRDDIIRVRRGQRAADCAD